MKHGLRFLLWFWLLNLCKVSLSPFTINFKNQDFKEKKIKLDFQYSYNVDDCLKNETYISFQHVSSPCDRGKHTYFDKNGAIYLLHKVCLIVCTLEFMSSGHGDDVLL